MTPANLAAHMVAAITLAGALAAPAAAQPVAFHPCDWVSVDEASALLGAHVQTRAWGDEAGSSDVSCSYTAGISDTGVQSNLRLPQSFPVDAVTQFGLATSGTRSTPVDGVGVRARCVYEPTTTPPSTTMVVLLSGNRLYRATSWYSTSCDQLKQFAQIAIGRIGA